MAYLAVKPSKAETSQAADGPAGLPTQPVFENDPARRAAVALRRRDSLWCVCGSVNGTPTSHGFRTLIQGKYRRIHAPDVASFGNQTHILQDRGNLDGAMAVHQQEELICHQLDNPSGLQTSLSNQAFILYQRGDLIGAMALFKEVELICRKLGDSACLEDSLNTQRIILQARDTPKG